MLSNAGAPVVRFPTELAGRVVRALTLLAGRVVRSAARLAELAATLAGACASATVWASELPSLDLGPFAAEGELAITRYAGDLDFPFGLVELPDGSLLVGSSVPSSPGGSLFASIGRVLRLVDADRDGVADGPAETILGGLAGPVTSLRRFGEHLIVAHRQRISFLRLGASPSEPLIPEGSLDFAFPVSWVHSSLGLAVRATPGQPGAFDVFFNLGSRSNASPTVERVAVSGLVAATLTADSVYRVTLAPAGETLGATDLTWVARGLRNALGMALDPRNGDLYLADNGIDGLTNPNEPLSADELDRVPAAEIGGPVEDFGFPDSFVGYRTGEVVGARGIGPVVAFQPIPPPDGAESEGPSEIAFAPEDFPGGLSLGLLVTFHGRFSLGGLANEENPLVYVDLQTGDYFHLIGNQEPGVGHLDSLLATRDTLFVADLSRTGGIGDARAGVIYAIRPVPEPGGGLLLLTGLAIAGARTACAARGTRANALSGEGGRLD